MAKKRPQFLQAILPSSGELGGYALSSVHDLNGIPTQRLAKDCISVGTYIHPKAGWRLPVDEARMAKWAKNFALMRERGVEIPLAKKHEPEVQADNTAGYVLSMFPDGGKLRFTCEARGQDNIDLARTVNQVSVFIEKNFKDGKGNTYDEAITHIALTPQPVVPNQEGFVSIAASRGQADVEIPVFALAAKESSMRKELLTKFRGLVQASAEAAEDEVLEKIGGLLDQQKSELDEQNKLIKDAASGLEAANEQVAKLKKDTQSELDGETAEERTQDVLGRIDGMAKQGMITPALAASLGGELCGSAEARNSYMLSRSANANDRGLRPVRAMRILDMFEEAAKASKAKAGEKTGGQGGMAFSLGADGSEDRQKTLDRMVSYAAPADPKSSLVM